MDKKETKRIKGKKAQEESPILKRQLELVEHFYKVDRENKIIHLRLHYATAEEILDCDIGDVDHPSFKTELMERIVDIINSFPSSYKVDVELQVADYQGYDPKRILQAFNDEFEFNHFCTNKDTRGNNIKALILVAVAVVIIFLKAFLISNGYLGTGTVATAYDCILDTLATLFIWEAGTVLFLNSSGHKALGMRILAQVHGLAMLNGTGEVVADENKNSMVSKWVETGKLYRIGGDLLCFFSGSMLVMGLSGVISEISNVVSGGNDAETIIATIIVWLIYFAIVILAVVSGYSYFCDRGKLRKACGVFAILFTILVIGDLSYRIIIGVMGGGLSFATLFRTVFSLLSDIGFAVGYYLLRVSRKQHKNLSEQ